MPLVRKTGHQLVLVSLVEVMALPMPLPGERLVLVAAAAGALTVFQFMLEALRIKVAAVVVAVAAFLAAMFLVQGLLVAAILGLMSLVVKGARQRLRLQVQDQMARLGLLSALVAAVVVLAVVQPVAVVLVVLVDLLVVVAVVEGLSMGQHQAQVVTTATASCLTSTRSVRSRRSCATSA